MLAMTVRIAKASFKRMVMSPFPVFDKNSLSFVLPFGLTRTGRHYTEHVPRRNINCNKALRFMAMPPPHSSFDPSTRRA
jgi:hypothetical protein